jgi:hypothetical protein
LAKLNPTNYVFNASIVDVQAAIKKSLGEEWGRELRRANSNSFDEPLYGALRMQGASLLWKGDGDTLSRGVLTQFGNEKDAYLYGGGSCVGLSKTYFKDGKPLVYFADFHIHLEGLGSQTRVTIFTINPSVVVGTEPHVAHGPAYVFGSVPPSSIEEFQILSRIGNQLHMTNMPIVIAPSSDAPLIKLNIPKQR